MNVGRNLNKGLSWHKARMKSTSHINYDFKGDYLRRYHEDNDDMDLLGLENESKEEEREMVRLETF